MADLLSDVGSDVREIPHGQKTVKTGALLCFLEGKKRKTTEWESLNE